MNCCFHCLHNFSYRYVYIIFARSVFLNKNRHEYPDTYLCCDSSTCTHISGICLPWMDASARTCVFYLGCCTVTHASMYMDVQVLVVNHYSSTHTFMYMDARISGINKVHSQHATQPLRVLLLLHRGGYRHDVTSSLRPQENMTA